TLKAARGKGLGRMLVAHILDHARNEGAKEIYLFTVGAEGFFERLGFRVIDRDMMPPAIQASDQFQVHCGDRAIAMVRPL
ncbi:MAG: GNAT family N-acetyltransferase, partial [Pseudomonadota bacterium]